MTLESVYVVPSVVRLPLDARPVPAFPGYVISRRGEVFSYWHYKRNGKTAQGEMKNTPHKIKTQYARGKRRVDLMCDGVQKSRSVEELLRIVFGE